MGSEAMMASQLLSFGGLLLLLVACHGVNIEDTTQLELHDTAAARLGLRNIEQDVDRDVWLAKSAQDDADAEDQEIARLLEQLEGLDETQPEQKEIKVAKETEIEIMETKAAKLKAVAKQKFDHVHTIIMHRTERIEQDAVEAMQEAEADVEKTKALRVNVTAMMSKAKMASVEYENAVTAGMGDESKSLELKAKKAMKEAQETARAAGSSSQAAKMALEHAKEKKAKADKSIKQNSESQEQLTGDGLRWVEGPIFKKMMTLCDQDYPTFVVEYRKIRSSAVFAKFRWDLKMACVHARNDLALEHDETDAEKLARLAADELKQKAVTHTPQIDESKPYPHKNSNWQMPKDGKVKKWCSTEFGSVPCSVLLKARKAGLLGDIQTDSKQPTQNSHHDSLMMIQVGQSGPLVPRDDKAKWCKTPFGDVPCTVLKKAARAGEFSKAQEEAVAQKTVVLGESQTAKAIKKDKDDKWCNTKFGKVPCDVLKSAQKAGLLTDVKAPDTTLLVELQEDGVSPMISGAETSFAASDTNPTSNFPGPKYGLPGYKESHKWETDVDIFSPVVFDAKYFNAAQGNTDGGLAAAKKAWLEVVSDDETKVPYCKQASPLFSLNTYYRANPAIKEATESGKCGQVLKNYLQSGILEGSPVYSASAEAEFAATQSDEELAQLQGNAHAQKVRLKSENLGANPNCDMGTIADSTNAYSWSFWYKPVSPGRVKRNLMSYGKATNGKQSIMDKAENGPAIFENTGKGGNKLQFKVSMDNNDGWSCTPSKTLAEATQQDDWHFVALVVNKEGANVFYDGEQVADCANTEGSPQTFPNRVLKLATSRKGMWESSKSSIKNMMYYPRTELSSELIQAEMVNVRLNTELSRLELAEALLAKEEGHQAKAETLLGEARAKA